MSKRRAGGVGSSRKSKSLRVSGRYRDVTLTATPEPSAFLFLGPPEKPSQARNRKKTPLKTSTVGVPSYSLEFLSPHSRVSAGFLRLSTLLKLGEPTEAMRLPQLSTCHPALLDKHTQRGRESSRLAVSHKLHLFRRFVSTVTGGWVHFSYTHLALPAKLPW